MNGTTGGDIQIGANFTIFSVLTFEVIGFVLLGLGVCGMYQGIEISHPVYSVLFLNLCFNFGVTTFNLVLVIVVPLTAWVRTTINTNFCGMLFHNTRDAIKRGFRNTIQYSRLLYGKGNKVCQN